MSNKEGGAGMGYGRGRRIDFNLLSAFSGQCHLALKLNSHQSRGNIGFGSNMLFNHAPKIKTSDSVIR